jgi:hypothetical protein
MMDRMADKRRVRPREWILAAVFSGTLGLTGCSELKRAEPAMIANPNLGPMTIAVAPALNLSGSTDFDPNRFADLMASELGYAEGIAVIPVSRVLSVLALDGREAVESQAHALELARLLGADAILVFAVTEYDPYAPPSIGLSAQLLGARSRKGGREVDPVALSRQATLAASGSQAPSRGLLGQVQGVFHASHESVVSDIRKFAGQRSADAGPYGWRKYIVSQQHFIRYCCHATVRMLLSGQDGVGLVSVSSREVRTR